MERSYRENSSENRDRPRDRSRTKKKRRFDSGPDPEKVKQELLTPREREYQREEEVKPAQGDQNAASNYRHMQTFSANDKHAKRAYIGNIPQDTDTIDLQCFLNISMREAGGCLDEGNPVLNSSFINLDKRFMFVELRSVEETT